MLFSRNLGLISLKDQDKLKNSCVLVAGVGGMGGVAAEVLVRMGIGRLVICDMDKFEDVNFNRQIHSNYETVNEYKVDVLKKEFLKINPNLEIRTFKEGVCLENILSMLEGVDVVINGMDKMFPSLILERTARANKITIIDAWLTPYASVFVMKPDSPHWEEFLNLPTRNTRLEDIKEEMCTEALMIEVKYTFSHFVPFEIIDREVVEKVLKGEKPRPSLAPVVWLSGVMMANETFKFLLGLETTDHAGVFYNQYDHQLMAGNIKGASIKKAS